MLRAIAAAKKKNDRIDAGKIADRLRCDFLPECHMASTAIRDRRRSLRYRRGEVRLVGRNPRLGVRKGCNLSETDCEEMTDGVAQQHRFEAVACVKDP
jgi:hypothetical protein